MKPLGNADSLGALMSMGPSTEDKQGHVYGRGVETMLEGVEEEGSVEEYSRHVAEKKRRLSVDQVKALEKNFELENKLEPERKVKLAQQLGLQPRQVAVWFQNRRARWKTKQLERDYNILKANFDALKHSYDSLQRENEALSKEIRELKSKLQEENTETESNQACESDKKTAYVGGGGGEAEVNLESFNGGHGSAIGASVFADVRDGLSDSDSSAILNEDNHPNAAAMSSDGVLQPLSFMVSSEIKFNCSSPSSMSCFEYSDSKAILGDAHNYQPQFVKMEEHNFFGGDESCNFFPDDQAPTLQWYCAADQWNP